MRALPNAGLVVISLISLCLLPLSARAQTTVDSFSPSGTVKQVRQVQARFSDQMVAFGDLRLGDPFSIDCPEKGAGRWIDGNNWSYDFVRDLPAGVACQFTLKPDAKDLAGKPLVGEHHFSFNTGGPAVIESLPRRGSRNIDEQQIFVLGLDAPASDATITQHAYCRADGINEKIGVRMIDGAEREQILAQRKDFVDRFLSVYFRARGVVWRATTAVRGDRLDQRHRRQRRSNAGLSRAARIQRQILLRAIDRQRRLHTLPAAVPAILRPDPDGRRAGHQAHRAGRQSIPRQRR